MAIKYQDGAVRLWQGSSKKVGNPGIGIRFEKKKCTKDDVVEIYEAIKGLLTKKYGMGIE